jgi:hypothetical protein
LIDHLVANVGEVAVMLDFHDVVAVVDRDRKGVRCVGIPGLGVVTTV